MSWVSTNIPFVGIRNILRYKNSDKILELGVGNGRNLVFLGKNGNLSEITGVDIDPNAIVAASEFASLERLNINLIEADITEFEIEPNSYDVIVCSMVLPVLKENQIQLLLEKIMNGTRRGGINFISTYVDPGVSGIRREYRPLRRFYLSHEIYMSKGWEVLEVLERKSKFPSEEREIDVECVIAKKP